jgi:hypothetical protein
VVTAELSCDLEFEETMAVFEGWTFAAARGASRKSLFQIAEASKIGPGVLEEIEHARDIDLTDSRFDIAAIERVVDIYGVLGFRIMPRTLMQTACVKRVQ